MASKTNSPLALFLALNLLFFALASGCSTTPSPTPPPKPTPPPCTGTPSPPPKPTPPPCPGTPSPPPNPTPPPSNGTCPRDALKLGICADVLGSLLGLIIGNPPVEPCCSLLDGLVDLEAAICLCTAIKANVLGINLNVPLSISLLLNVCSKNVPQDFICA
ncbi:hypothetical protein M8C21_006455 [Ambrosia artemisiifolia]|uniref:Bifunctional inhibitor/plant lipid transfer protein/seed storage helical domain-containing protein n=1 Tax=Ambrosia artemisiifolia TaxID=4212 RepID=A0AAD5C319_AMBAR|nr:hypothetical protein M8C21_006455 [Ambrosia artemisiifolia]